jgi:hypothetical protein
MVKKALFVRLEAKPGTMPWFGVKLGPSTYGIFDAFPDEARREAHLAGKVGAALKEKAAELFPQRPSIEKMDCSHPHCGSRIRENT